MGRRTPVACAKKSKRLADLRAGGMTQLVQADSGCRLEIFGQVFHPDVASWYRRATLGERTTRT